MMPARYTPEEAIQIFKENGFELLEPYINTRISHKCRCKCNKIVHMRLSNIKQGKHCRECGNKKIAEKKLLIKP